MSSHETGHLHEHGPGVRRRDLILLGTVVVLIMATVSVANLAVPDLANSDLAPRAVELTWFVNAYVIAFACLLLPGEMLGHRFGEERVLLAGLGLVAVGGLLALVADAMPLLVASRAVAGVGAGLALPQTLSILLIRARPAQHAGVVATWTAATSVAGVVGNGLGGAAISLLGWRAAVVATLPLALVCLLGVVLVTGVRRPPDPAVRFDARGPASSSSSRWVCSWRWCRGRTCWTARGCSRSRSWRRSARRAPCRCARGGSSSRCSRSRCWPRRPSVGAPGGSWRRSSRCSPCSR
ncbi:MFS transporter [Litorihabitans aurantiacus]|uniref:Major facilitator superfamily (MFS) profile domain-containing protein n=1 Tax=Litorihabitans aurantiacus TaxID=1930061 RepID=A0AA37ULZ2_9MICO|nr:MFS transporter [Litorihabitans aurantiacus]GMA30910.1 hypothetical protein GCM10025875_09020 [Litorihabitans aurantiacus]